MKEWGKIFSNPWRLLIGTAAILTTVGFVVDLKATLTSGGIDLRNRIVGARLMQAALDPYHFKWTPGEPEIWLDPLDKPESPITRTSVPPSVLAALTPIASLPYRYIRLLWLAVQWGCLLGTLFLLSKCTTSKEKAYLVWSVGLLFSLSYSWRNHVEVGQIYIIYSFFIALAHFLMFKFHVSGKILGGALLGTTASMKLPLLIVLIPMFIFRRWRILSGFLIGVLVAVGGSIFMGGAEVWENYFSAMRVHGFIEYSWEMLPKAVYPERIEGMTNLLKHLSGSPDTSMLGLFNKYFEVNISTVLMPVVIIISLFAALFLWKNRKKQPSISLIFLIGLVFVFIADFFLPGPRYGYQDVIWILLLGMIIVNSGAIRGFIEPPSMLVIISFFLSFSLTWLPFRGYIAQASMVLYVAFKTLEFLKKSPDMG